MEPSQDVNGIGASRDILCNPSITGAVFWLPIVALVASGVFDIPSAWRTGIWVASFGTMGIGCIVNAVRCRRVHCYLTGPFFLWMAVLTLLYGVGLWHLGPRGWSAISLVALAGGALLCCVPELFLGRYLYK
jgi:hypothetical protein